MKRWEESADPEYEFERRKAAEARRKAIADTPQWLLDAAKAGERPEVLPRKSKFSVDVKPKSYFSEPEQDFPSQPATQQPVASYQEPQAADSQDTYQASGDAFYRKPSYNSNEMPLADENDPLKGKLYPYLRDRKKKREEAARLAQEASMDEQSRYDGGSLLAALSKGSSMIGTINGKQADSTIIPKMNEDLNKSFLQNQKNQADLRGEGEEGDRFDMQFGQDVGKDYYDRARNRDLDAEKMRQFDAGYGLQRDERDMKLRKYLDDKKKKNLQQAADFDTNGNMTLFDKETGETIVVPGTKRKPMPAMVAAQMPNFQVVPGVTGPNGELVTRDKSGNTRMEPLPAGAKSTRPEPKTPGNKNAEQYESQATKSIGVSSMIDAKVAEIQRLAKANDKKGAIALAKNMVKDINSVFGADAIGVAEEARIAASLQNVRTDFFSGNYGLGPDLDAFLGLATSTSTSARNAAKANYNIAKQLRSGVDPTEAITSTVGQTSPGGAQPGTTKVGKGGIKYRFKGGNPKDKSNWEEVP